MKKIAKLLIADNADNYLALTLNNHPLLGNRVDLPGGTVEEGETLFDAMIREVEEEIGLTLDPSKANIDCLYEGTDYTDGRAMFALYQIVVDHRPEIILSWEHSAYAWLPKDELLRMVTATGDKYMGGLVADCLRKLS